VRAVVQRVTRASVTVDGARVGAIDAGLMVLVGVAVDDTEADASQLAHKIAGLRLFSDAEGAMNLALADAGGAILLVSQFTLLGDARRGRRP
jgi:D-tyrosyl-tRNA(Tyr) deacylase